MYLSDLFVSAHKRGGSKHVDVLFEILDGLPQDFWDKLGGIKWLEMVKAKRKLSPDKFYADLERYAESQEWSKSLKSLGEFVQDADV